MWKGNKLGFEFMDYEMIKGNPNENIFQIIRGALISGEVRKSHLQECYTEAMLMTDHSQGERL